MRAFRYIVLPRGYCDVRCVFCHEEGIAGARSTAPASALSPATLAEYLEALRPLGFRCLTFSGGEPMLAWPHIRHLGESVPRDFDLTLITNGLRLGEVAQWRCRTGRDLTVHLNLPAVDDDVYRQILRTRRGRLAVVLRDVALAVESGVVIDVNLVLQGSRNTDAHILNDVHQVCRTLGVRSLRFIEDANILDPAGGLDRLGLPGWGKDAATWHCARLERVFDAGVVDSVRVEFVRCDSALLYTPADADAYFWSPGSVRIGLTGPAHAVSSVADLVRAVQGVS